jgi:hypothetical protein
MSLHSLRSILALAPVLALLYLACGKTDPSPTQTESGGDAGSAGNAGSGGTKLLGQGGGGNSGSAGAGLSGGQGGLSGKGGSGPAGMGGQAATGGQGNATPEWKEIGKIQGYPILQLQNPSDFQAFEWKPCDWTSMPGCEQAFVDEEFLNWKSKNTIFVSVHDDGEKARGILLSFRNEEQIVALVGENGHIEDAFKNQNEDLFFTISSIHGTNYGINARQKNKTNSGAIAGKIGKQPHLFDWDNSGLFKGSIIVWAVLGKSYFATQWMSLGIQSYSLMGQNQTRLVEVEKLNPDALGIQDLISADDYFLYTTYNYTTYSTPQTMISNGKDPGIPYTTPPPGAADGSIEYANSHVAWLRGFGQKATNDYEKVELWASEFSPDPAQLKPYKVSSITGGQVSTANWAMHGGWGRLAYQEYDLSPSGQVTNIRVRVFDLKTLEKRDIPLPLGERARFIHGVTKSHVWFVTDGFDNAPRQLYRWKIDSVPVVP